MNVEFADIFEDCTKLGFKIKTEDYQRRGKYCIIDQGQNEIAGYTDLEDGLFKDVPAIIFGDHTRIIKYVTRPFFLGADGVKVLRSKKTDADYKYLFYALKSLRIPNTGYNRHFKWLKETTIKLVPLWRQKQIVQILDQVAAIKAARQKQLDALDELVKARFIEMFGEVTTNSKGFNTRKGKELFNFSSGKFLPAENRLEHGIPVYGGNGIAWYTKTPLINYPTIIIGRVGAQCGNIHAVTIPVWITDNAIFIKEQKTNSFCLEFLTELMKAKDFFQFADFSGQPKITQKPLEESEYIIPPKELQNQYVDFVHQVVQTKTKIRESLAETETLFQSLMQEYFG